MNGVGNESDDYKAIYFYCSSFTHFDAAFFFSFPLHGTRSARQLLYFGVGWFPSLQKIIIALRCCCYGNVQCERHTIRKRQWMEDMRSILFLDPCALCRTLFLNDAFRRVVFLGCGKRSTKTTETRNAGQPATDTKVT